MTEIVINQIAQSKIDFKAGCELILNEPNFDYQSVFIQLKNYIFNSIPDKTTYNSETYQNAIHTIPLKPTFTPIVILKTFSAKMAFNKLEEIHKDEQHKTIISMLWIFKQTDTERRRTECKNGCRHKWHNIY